MVSGHDTCRVERSSQDMKWIGKSIEVIPTAVKDRSVALEETISNGRKMIESIAGKGQRRKQWTS